MRLSARQKGDLASLESAMDRIGLAGFFALMCLLDDEGVPWCDWSAVARDDPDRPASVPGVTIHGRWDRIVDKPFFGPVKVRMMALTKDGASQCRILLSLEGIELFLAYECALPPFVSLAAGLPREGWPAAIDHACARRADPPPPAPTVH